MKRWSEQELGIPLLEVLRRVRTAIWNGRLVLQEWDHNSPQRVPGLSNKQLRIAGAMLRDDPETTHQQAWEAICEAVGMVP